MADQLTFGGRYTAEHFIGVPGRLEAFSGLDTTNQQKVAIITATPPDADATSKWTQRAQAVTSIQGAGIAKLLDWGTETQQSTTSEGETIATSAFFVVQQWVNGTDMGTVVAKQGPIPAEKAATYGAQIAGSLQAIHAKNIIDGDIRPEDVVQTGDGNIVLAAVGAPGMADRWVPPADASPAAAQYLAPEQCKGEPASVASDIYGLGAVLYFMVTGKAPFDGPDAENVCEQQQNSAVPSPSKINPSVPAGLEAVIMRALAKNPISRYSSAAEMRQALEAVASGGQTQVMPAIVEPPKQRKVWPWVVAALIAVALIAGGLFAAWWFGYIGGVTVPDLNGQTPAQAGVTLKNAELILGDVSAQPNYPKGTKLGTVFEQSTAPGGKARKGAAIAVSIAGGETQQVPNVVGQSESEAINSLNTAGFQLAPVERKFDAKVAQGSVIAQTPDAGTDQLKGSTVTIVVSKGPETAEVPNVLGKSEADATNTLQQAGFKVQVQQTQSDQVAQGNVAQQSPAGGTTANVGATVNLSVSTGKPAPKQVVIPNVVGMSQNDANAAIQNLGLKTSFQMVVSPTPADKGKCVQTDPGVGSTVDVGSTVILRIGQ